MTIRSFIVPLFFDKNVTIYRYSPYILEEKTILDSMSPTRQPDRGIFCEVRISGASEGTGTVTISGKLNGTNVSEVFTFSGNGALFGSQKFDEITSITTSGFTEESIVGKIQIKAKTKGGEDHNIRYLLASSIFASMDFSRSGYGMNVPGEFDTDRVRFFIDRHPDVTIREKDEIHYDGYNYSVISATLIRDHHWEIIATKQIS